MKNEAQPIQQETPIKVEPDEVPARQGKPKNGAKKCKRHQLSNLTNTVASNEQRTRPKNMTNHEEKENYSECDTCPEDEFDSDYYDK